MDGKCTPGPWKVVQVHNRANKLIAGPDGWSLATVHHRARMEQDVWLSSEAGPNAALIASAPEMAERIAELETFIYNEITGDPAQVKKPIDTAMRTMLSQAERIAELEAALQTYANHDNWTAGVAPSNNPRIFSHPANRFGPPWNIAEQALAGAEEDSDGR